MFGRSGEQNNQNYEGYPYDNQQSNPSSSTWIPDYDPDPNIFPDHALPSAPPSSGSQEWYLNQQRGSYNHAPPQTFPSHGSTNYPPDIPPTFKPPPFTPHTPSKSITPETAEVGIGIVDGKADKEESAVQQANKKRKKTSIDRPVKEESTNDDEKERRTKTGRACDACRTKKIRCDILAPSQSPGAQGIEPKPICAHCKQYELECTFFLPITETRFKKKKDKNSASYGKSLAPFLQDDGLGYGLVSVDGLPPLLDSTDQGPREITSGVEGSTSLSFLLSTTIPASAAEQYDLREHNKWEISDDGNGIIRVTAPPTQESGGYFDPKRGHSSLNKPVLNAQTISLLVNAYFDHLAPLFPIISRTEFASKPNPSPLLLCSICGLGATRRTFPREVFAGVRGVINGLLRSNDILSDARFEHVQALLLLAQVGDLHAQPTATTASASLIRTATATRMAQDLGLHRESTVRAQTAQDLASVELRRRVWAACVIFDRWYGAALGVPLLVDLLDCDVLFPAPYDIIPDTEPAKWPIEPSFMGLAEQLKLSIFVGRVIKTIYSPTGLKHATDDQLESLLADMMSWKASLPDELRFTGPTSSPVAGMLHLSYTSLQFLFWRVFIRITHTCPPHLTFSLNTEYWDMVVQYSAESIEWLSQNDQALDTVFIYAYTATSCALIQYHTWARRRTARSLEMLRLVKNTAERWEAAVQPEQMSIRRKTCETMKLMYEAALRTKSDLKEEEERLTPVNIVAGVSPRIDRRKHKCLWVKDATRPSGGIWVAIKREEMENCGVPAHNLIHESELEPGSRLHESYLASKAQSEGGSMTTPSSGTGGQSLGGREGQGEMKVGMFDVPMVQNGPGQGPGPGGPEERQGGSQGQSMSDMELNQVQSATNVNPQLNFDGAFSPGVEGDPMVNTASRLPPLLE